MQWTYSATSELATGDRPPVSIITPTHNRERFLPLTYSCFQSQNWPSLEWLVGDSSPAPSPFMSSLRDLRVTYLHDTTNATIWAKRNALVANARRIYIVHFIDTNY